MYTGVIVGTVTSTIKDPNLQGVPLLVVQKGEDNKSDLIVAADATRQAGVGDFVYLINSKEASRSFRANLMPVDAAVIGFVDEYYEEDR
jgi:ethanolamine utilization protein EutN